MRTSGASTDTPLTIVVVCVAIGMLIIFAGGPDDVLRVLDRAVHLWAMPCSGPTSTFEPSRHRPYGVAFPNPPTNLRRYMTARGSAVA
jgi:hypothetical protein